MSMYRTAMLRIELQGNLAALLKAAQAQSTGAPLAPLGRWGDERSPGDDDLAQIMLVAGACNRRNLQLWNVAAEAVHTVAELEG